ncbi:MAG: protease inhibitor I42 family protein [Hyphomonadaceae bacterium]
MIRLVLLVAALAVAACAPSQEDQQMAGNGAIAAPTPADVAVRVTAAQNGQTVQVGVNQRFAVELIGVPTAGYLWAPAQVPAFITRAGEATGNTAQEQSQPGFAGGNHWEVLMFAATEPGSGELVLEQRRPWESNEPPADVFRVTIVAQ